jgi:SAM-dependent methyltransferase
MAQWFGRTEDERGKVAAYQYVAAGVEGQRVLEVGCGEGLGVRWLLELGASAVCGVITDRADAPLLAAPLPSGVELRRFSPPRLPVSAGETFGFVAVPDARLCQVHPWLVAELRRVLQPDGLLLLRAPNADHPEAPPGLGYDALLQLVEGAFPEVRILGQSPFIAYSLYDLSSGDAEPDVSVDASLMRGGVEEPVAYLALCARKEAKTLAEDYGIVQFPQAGISSVELSAEGEEGGDPSLGDAPSPGESSSAASPAEGAAPAAPLPPPVLGGNLGAGTTSLSDRSGGLLSRWRWPGIFR